MKPRLHLLVAFTLLAGCGNLSAQFVWTGSSTVSGSIFDPTNWQSGVPVGNGTENLQFGDVVGAQTGISFSTSAFANITFVTGTSRPFYIASGSGGSPVLTLGGNVAVQSGAGINFDSTLGLSLTAGSHNVDVAALTLLQLNGNIGGAGSLVVTNAGGVVLGGINNYSGGTTVDLGGNLGLAGVNARINHSGADVIVGATGGSSGTLAIAAGGQVSDNNGRVASTTSTTTGTVTVDGSGSSWTNANFLYVGEFGTGSLGVTNGATVTSSFFSLGTNAGANGTLHLDGAGTHLSSSLNIFVGDAGQGNLNITNGATATGFYSDIGNAVTGSGVVTVDGTGSTWTQNNITVGVAGAGTLAITNGGTAITTAYLNVGQTAGSTGIITVDGPGSTFNNNAYIRIGASGAGTLHISNHGTVVGATITVGDGNTGNGTVTIDGAGSSLTSTNILSVGFNGSGSLAITNGGSAVVQINGLIGQFSGSIGSATVDGGGSTWTNTSNLFVGEQGTGTLAITNHGAVSSANTYVGNSSGGYGLLTLDGAGSRLTSSGQFYIGLLGTGVFSITNGGHATDNVGSIGNNAGSGTGAASVDGPGSVWDTATNLHVGDSTIGSLSVTNGGVVNSSDGYLATFSTGTGTVDIAGAGSAWNVANALYVGYAGNGVFLMNNGGAVNINGGTGTMYLGYSSGSIGQLFIGSGSGPGGVVDAANITTLGGTGVVSFQTSTNSTSPYFLTRDGTSTGVPVVISGPTSVQVGSGYIVLNANNTYTGGTTVALGTLVAGSNNAFGTGTVTFGSTAATLNVASGVTVSNSLNLAFGGILAGNGTFATPITVGSGVTLAPGNSPGALSFSSGLTLAGGGVLNFQVQLAGGTAGTGYDLVNVSGGTLNITANSSLPFTIGLQSLDATGAPGNVSDFNPSSSYSWTIFTAAGGITGFSAADFVINTSGFSNHPTLNGFFVTQSGNQILLDFSPVPEPSTYALLVAGLGLVGWTLRRRRAGSL